MRILVQRFVRGWYYRRGSASAWVGPFVTEHVARCVRDSVTKQPWGVP